MGCKCHSCAVAVLNRSWIQGRGSVVSETAVCEGLELYMMWPELCWRCGCDIAQKWNFVVDILQAARSGFLKEISAGLESFSPPPAPPPSSASLVRLLNAAGMSFAFVSTFARLPQRREMDKQVAA